MAYILEACVRPVHCVGLTQEKCAKKLLDGCLEKCKFYRTSFEKGMGSEDFDGFDPVDVLVTCGHLKQVKIIMDGEAGMSHLENFLKNVHLSLYFVLGLFFL